MYHPTIVANKKQRWKLFLVDTPPGALFDYPANPQTWKPYVEPQIPMYDHLQMDREDVRYEMTHIKQHFQAKHVKPRTAVLCLGGDGLTYSQMIHELADEPDKWVLVSEKNLPTILPSLGLEPHGGYHGLHTGLRNYRPFVVAIGTGIGSPTMVIEDPPVSSYNMARFDQYKLIRGVSEWLQELSKTAGAPNLTFASDWLAGAEKNIDFEWAFHYLYDFGFWWLQFMHERRENGSEKLDLLWREFVVSGRTMVANKTNYGFMAIMQASVCVRECVHVTPASPRAPLTPSWLPYCLCGPGVGARAKEQLSPARSLGARRRFSPS